MEENPAHWNTAAIHLLGNILIRRQLRSLGHVKRMPSIRWSKTLLNSRDALFRDCPAHYVHFYELRLPVSWRYLSFLHCFCSASTHSVWSTSIRHFGRFFAKYLYTSYSRQEFSLMHGRHNLHFKVHVHGRIKLCGRPHAPVRPQVVRPYSELRHGTWSTGEQTKRYKDYIL